MGSLAQHGTAALRACGSRIPARPRQQHCTLLPSAIASHGDQGGGSHDHGGHVLSPQVISSILLSYSSFEQQSRPIPPDLTRLYPLLLQALCLAAAAGSPGSPPRASPKVLSVLMFIVNFVLDLGPFVLARLGFLIFVFLWI